MKVKKMGVKELGLLKNLVDEFSASQNKIAQKANSKFRIFFATSGASFDALRREAGKSIKSKNGVIFAVFDDEMPVGYLYAVIHKMPSYSRIKKRGHICSIFVDKKYRRKGLATVLYKEVKKWFKMKNMKYLSIGVMPTNYKAIQTYCKWGFAGYMDMMMNKI